MVEHEHNATLRHVEMYQAAHLISCSNRATNRVCSTNCAAKTLPSSPLLPVTMPKFADVSVVAARHRGAEVASAAAALAAAAPASPASPAFSDCHALRLTTAQCVAAADAYVQTGMFVTPAMDEVVRHTLMQRLEAELLASPEFKAGCAPNLRTRRHDKAHLHTGGSFGGVSLASNFYGRVSFTLYSIQRELLTVLVPHLLAALARSGDARHAAWTVSAADGETVLMNGRPAHVHVLPDRILWRHPELTPKAEGGHYDLFEPKAFAALVEAAAAGGEEPYAAAARLQSYMWLGGWLALDGDAAHVLHCVPGSGLGNTHLGGFKKLKKKKKQPARPVPTVYGVPKEAEGMDDVEGKPTFVQVPVPLGSMLCFDQTTLHEVFAGKVGKRPLVRLMAACVFSDDPRFLYDLGLVARLHAGELPRLKSMQEQVVAPVFWRVNNAQLLARAAQRRVKAGTKLVSHNVQQLVLLRRDGATNTFTLVQPRHLGTVPMMVLHKGVRYTYAGNPTDLYECVATKTARGVVAASSSASIVQLQLCMQDLWPTFEAPTLQQLGVAHGVAPQWWVQMFTEPIGAAGAGAGAGGAGGSAGGSAGAGAGAGAGGAGGSAGAGAGAGGAGAGGAGAGAGGAGAGVGAYAQSHGKRMRE